MDKNAFFRKGGPIPSNEQSLDTRLFYHNAGIIYARYDEWKNDDRYYFIPLFMRMTYSIRGVGIELAPDPVWLGSFARCTLEHPELFQYKCPECGNIVLPFRYCGSPLSGRVDLEGECSCGWKGYEMVSGWFIRGEALRGTIISDQFRYTKSELIHPGVKPASVKELLDYLK